MSGQGQPIIIKKKKVVAGGGHHGGAWKVAYADFVTAMMAFFLLMWLLNATTEDQRKGLADYFDPSIPVSRISGGGQGALNGESIFSESPKLRDAPEDALERFDPAASQAEPAEDRAFDELAEQIQDTKAALASDDLASHIQTRMTPEGLVVELIDQASNPLFAVGSSDPSPLLEQLLKVIAPVLATATNDMQIIGHTDARAYSGAGGYTNWELSADRASVARRLLVASGLPAEQVVGVVGRAATEPLSEDPFAAQNRRIAVLLKPPQHAQTR